ncbi:hypothetical protein DEAC_c29530 [Desulfosporosinus acididurans]|uniref:Uncharacterized protein n=1 Tax=Desulfosporosinus acididurans TaxID=476652 RepID=A0A0J1IJZ2_9FIRM|nr:hypothetical protein [Desulfosporosinus acididurans]KLU64986.1 hypothetical protein DEAC_c29530 [Desulfosporosinus acididurans]
MWPRRRLLLVAPSGAPGIDGARALFKEFNLDFVELDPAGPEISSVSSQDWLEKPFACSANEIGPFTEVVVWPGLDDVDWRPQQILKYSLSVQSINVYLHNFFENEIVIPFSEQEVLTEGYPLAGHILKEAGFEPSILWQTKDRTWKCEERPGFIWVLPDSWLSMLAGKETMGRCLANSSSEVLWKRNEMGIDFYRGEGETYVGHLPRRPNPAEEPSAAASIAMCLNLGVSWLDITFALKSAWTDNIMTDNLRWNGNGFGWNARTCGEELLTEGVNDMENRRTC